jgi:plastocyanin
MGVLALVFAAPLLLAACGDDDNAEPASASSSTTSTTSGAVNTGPTVEVIEFSFTPGSEIVTVGEAVTWSNEGNSPHTVTPEELPDGTTPFASTRISPGQTFVQTFNTPGTYAYICSIHPDRMSGTVVVEPA